MAVPNYRFIDREDWEKVLKEIEQDNVTSVIEHSSVDRQDLARFVAASLADFPPGLTQWDGHHLCDSDIETALVRMSNAPPA